MKTMNTTCFETQVREMAAKGKTRKEAAQEFGLSDSRLKLICQAMGGVKWQRAEADPESRRSGIGAGSRIGHRVHEVRVARPLQKSREQIYKHKGFEGSLVELMVKFKVTWSQDTVRKRLKAGMTLEDAFFSGRPKVRDWSNCAW